MKAERKKGDHPKANDQEIPVPCGQQAYIKGLKYQ
jgi:hypothetical protein